MSKNYLLDEKDKICIGCGQKIYSSEECYWVKKKQDEKSYMKGR